MISLPTTWRKAVTLSTVTAALTLGTAAHAIAQALNGAGATFPAPLLL